MAYEHKPGTFTLFKNENKTNENQPDYKGSGMDLNGVECWVSAWVKRPEGKSPFLSCVTQSKEQQQAAASSASTPEQYTDMPF